MKILVVLEGERLDACHHARVALTSLVLTWIHLGPVDNDHLVYMRGAGIVEHRRVELNLPP